MADRRRRDGREGERERKGGKRESVRETTIWSERHLLDAAGGVVQEPCRDRGHEGPLPAAAGPAVAGGDGHIARHLPEHLDV